MTKPLRDKLVGAWELVSYVERDSPDGPVRYPHGEDATGLDHVHPGRLHVGADPVVGAAELRPPGRQRWHDGQAAAAALGYLAYSGRYFVDESTGTPS